MAEFNFTPEQLQEMARKAQERLAHGQSANEETRCEGFHRMLLADNSTDQVRCGNPALPGERLCRQHLDEKTVDPTEDEKAYLEELKAEGRRRGEEMRAAKRHPKQRQAPWRLVGQEDKGGMPAAPQDAKDSCHRCGAPGGAPVCPICIEKATNGQDGFV